jgi:uroporphyrinogen-III synthase
MRSWPPARPRPKPRRMLKPAMPAPAGPSPVVITRPRAQAAALVQAVAALGREVVELPLLEIAPLPDQSGLRATLADLSRYAMVAFVSPNAVDAAFAHMSAWPAGVLLAVLGEGSRVALAQHGVTDANARIVSPPDPANSDSEHLLAALPLEQLRGKEVLIVRGESGRELLVDALRAAGAIVSTVAAYRRSVPALTPTLAAQLDALLARHCDWIVTSSEALRGLAALLEEMAPGTAVAKMQHQHWIVPHARIAETAKQLGLAQLTLTGSGDERLLAALQSRP